MFGMKLGEDSGSSFSRKAQDRQRAVVLVAVLRVDSAGQRCICEQSVQIHGRFGGRNSVAPCRDRAVEEGQRFAIVERAHLRHETRKQVERAIGFRNEAGERLSPVAALRSEEHTSELQSLMRISYAVFCLKKKIR